MYNFLKTDLPPLPLNEAELQQFEEDNKIQLPDQLKDFYRKANGVPMRSIHLNALQNSYVVVDRFFPIFAGSMSADHILEIYRMSSFVPESYFPIALSDEGDDFFLDTDGGGIYLVPLDRPRTRMQVAASLSEFFHMLETGTIIHGHTEVLC